MNKPPATLLCISSDIPNLGIDAIANSCPNLPAYELWDVAIESKRPGYWERLINFCKIRGIREIYCSRLISLGRGSITNMLNLIATLEEEMHVSVHILNSETHSPASVLCDLWLWERECKSLAQSASLARARAEGSRVGRPPKEVDIHRIRRLTAEGKSSRDIAEITGLSHTTVLRRIEAMKNPGVIPQTDGM